MVRAFGLHPKGLGFESLAAHKNSVRSFVRTSSKAPAVRFLLNKRMSKSEFNPELNPEVKKIVQERVHLREDVMPIRRQIVDSAESSEELESVQEEMERDEGVIHWVDLDGGDLDALKESGFKQAGEESYLISPISERDWFSDHYFNCTAVVAIGKDVNTGKEISFLTHQDPNYFIDGGSDKTEMFSRELSDSLKELKARSQEDTVEVLLLGGNFNTTAVNKDYQHHQYKQSIERLRRVVQESLGFDPKVLAGPNNRVGSETVVVVETQKRKVWVERSKQPLEFDQPYQANMLDEAEKKWLGGNESN